MTREEINIFLANTKVYVAGKSKEIQEKLFSFGYKWYEGDTDVLFTECPFLYINNNHHISYGCDMCVFIEHYHHEITAEEILSLELTEHTYRPFKTQEECWKEMIKHQPFGWVFSKNKEAKTFICYISNNLVQIHDGCTFHGWNFGYKEMFDKYTFADGTPFGIRED